MARLAAPSLALHSYTTWYLIVLQEWSGVGVPALARVIIFHDKVQVSETQCKIELSPTAKNACPSLLLELPIHQK